MNKLFSFHRFNTLVRKHLIEESKTHLISLVAFVGGLFLLFYILHLLHLSWDQTGFHQQTKMFLMHLVILGGGILYIGTSFSAFRSREDTLSYLLIPATRFEKFIFEYLFRMVLFTAMAPIIYWLVANAELAFASALHQQITYQYQSFSDLLKAIIIVDYDPYHNAHWEAQLWGLFAIWIVFNVALIGSITFRKLPVLKTLFAVGLFFLINAALIMLTINLLDASPNRYGSLADFNLWLIPSSDQAFVRYSIAIFLIINIILVLSSYLKLKEKEA